MNLQGLSPSIVNRNLLFAGIFLVSLSGLALEIAITRIFSAAMWYHFAFVAVSVALLGLGSSGLLVHYKLKKLGENWGDRITVLACLGITLSIPLTLFVMHSLSSQLLYLPLYMLLFTIPFFCVGIVISMAFSAFARVAGKLYASDLIGASIGSLAVILLLNFSGGEGTSLVVGLLAAICATLFSLAARDKKKMMISIAFVAFASSLLVVNYSTQIFAIPTDPTAQQDLPIFLRENPGSHIVETKWNSFSRIDVVEGITGDCTPGSKDPVFNQPQCADEGLIAKIFIDGGAGTNVISWDGSLNSRQGLTSWIQYIPFTLEQDPKVLIIGSGGGRDVVAALVSGSRDVTSVEINPIIFETVQSYGKKAGNVYSHQYVDANVDEGRSFVSKSDEKYDIIYIPFVDTWASVSSGGLGVSENFLYTVEAFQEYYDHLSENGKIVSVRWLIDAPRFVSTYAELLERNGVSQSRLSEHLVVVSSESVTKDPSVTMVVFSKTPFAQSEINYFHESFSSNGYKPIVIPDRVALEPYKSFLNGEISQEEFHNKFSQKAHPVTDDSPFFLSFEKPIPKILEVLFYISIAIAAGFLVGPYLFIRRTQSVQLNRGLVCLYFAALGIGFILVELSLLQKLILLLGNPTMTFAILLFTILISSGIGSLVSSKIVSKNTKNLSLMIGCIIAIGALYIVVVPSIVYSVISEEFVTKTIISVGLLFPIGFAMGMPLPTIMRFLKSYEPGLVPWMWAVNGAFSVLGAILSVVIGILFGASYAMALGLGVYSVAMAVSLAWKKKPIEVLASR